ncbi:xylose isomerase [Paenibacillus crassostreae]|uniref:Xylose isomerase n=2 Tax=Paenibacillus crassostreae TaxID=1763538 RepID=A0A167EU44_9BACL|nr:xylose isomerase [Paenibacillus crassostreae]
MQLGILAHIFGKQPYADLAKSVATHGFSYVQLALSKALSDIDSTYGKLSPGLANTIGEAFDQQGVRIAVLGCYIDPVNPNKEQRRMDLNRFKEHLRYARDFGCSMVATETGNLNTYQSTFPDRFEEMGWKIFRESMEELTEEAEKWGVHIAVEPVSVHTVHSKEHTLRLFEEIPSSNLGLLFDPCNMMKIEHVEDQASFLHGIFQDLYSRMIMIHSKDVAFSADQVKGNPVPGKGILDYPLFFELLQTYTPHIDISLEGVTAEQSTQASTYLREIWNSVSRSFQM